MAIPTLHLICNAHLDPVWQWRWEEGCAEALSTFSTAVHMLRHHAGLIFNHNEAILYQWVKQYDPALFEEIRRLVGEGRWAISGGWFLQPDVNLPGIESLVRHITEGRRFFREEFGVEPLVAYNFDSFGHTGGLPQLLQRTGYKMYIHMRPQQPEMPLPADLYRWRGVDGSEIPALRISVGLYHTERDNIEQRLREGVELALRLNRDVPVFWGIGDHGGGATAEDLERIDRFIAVERRVRIVHSTPERLFEALRHLVRAAPVIEGDLQRVFTGCYTSLARLKRRAQTSLGELAQAETLSAASWWLRRHAYPASQLAEAWRDHLFNDFHDILPGSCTQPAEQDALDQYGRVAETVRRLRLGAAAALNAGPVRQLYIPVTILNTNPSLTAIAVEVDCMLDLRPKWTGTWHLRVVDLEGREVASQEEQPESLLPFNGWRRRVCFMATTHGAGIARYAMEIMEGPPSSAAASPALPHRFSEEDGLVDYVDAGEGRQCLAGALLRPLIVEDDGDAWGSDRWSYRKEVAAFSPVLKQMTLAAGPIRTITETVLESGCNSVVIDTVAYSRWRVLDMRVRVKWNEQHRRLKLSIPTLFRSSAALCEVPGGAIMRPADGQEHVHGRWVMLSGDIDGRPAGLGVVHSGLHGFDLLDGELRLSALRSAAYCHEQGFHLDAWPARKYMDQGVHEFRLLVTAGDPAQVLAMVSSLADWLSAPPVVYAHLPIGQGGPGGEERFLDVSPSALRLTACKRSWDGKALILRLHETTGTAREGSVRLYSPAVTAQLSFAPFELKTIRCERDGTWKEVDPVHEE